MTRHVALTIRGRVQGVGYRAWTVREARRLGLAGHVRNRVDGAVEALLSGPTDAVAAMIAACHAGPSQAVVHEVTVTEIDAAPEPGFHQRPTA